MSIVAEGLSKRYSDKPVLANLDLAVEREEIVGIHGANASGKSTLVQLLSGVLRPDGGFVKLAGVDLIQSPARAKRTLTAVFQETLFDQRWKPTAALVAHSRFYRGHRSSSEVRDILVKLGIHDEDLPKPILALSGGSKKKVEFAKCLVSDTPCLLLDEPFAGFDATSRDASYELLKQFRDQGRAILWCDHDVRALQLADRVLELENGHLTPVSLQEVEVPLMVKAEVHEWRDDLRSSLMTHPRINDIRVADAAMSDAEVNTLLREAGVDPTGKNVQVMHVDGDVNELLKKLGVAPGEAQLLSRPATSKPHVILTISMKPAASASGETDLEWLRGILTEYGLTVVRVEVIEE